MEIPVIVGGGLVVIGVGIGIGLTGKGAMEAIGRQPDASGKIQVAALILAALVEGIGFAALFALLRTEKTQYSTATEISCTVLREL